MNTIARLESLSAERGVTLYSLAQKSGVAYSTISNAKARSTQLSVNTIERLCTGLGISLSDFFAERRENACAAVKQS